VGSSLPGPLAQRKRWPEQQEAMAQGNNTVWVWAPLEKSKDFRHPADIPTEDEAVAKACFIDGLRGPRSARISPVTMLQSKGNMAMIAEKGATREVPKFMILPWYEGLLILEEMEACEGKLGHLQASWWDDELRSILAKERAKSQSGRLNGTLYAEKRLLNNAVTGTRFVDTDEREWAYRRENIKIDDQITLTEGEDADGFFRIKDVIGYLPPWEAFHSEKCGFYQDFYQVKWQYPYSEVDYSSVENGCVGGAGATWEPDECLPAQLDALRLSAKKAWIKRRREQELRQQQSSSAGSPTGTAVKRERPDSEGPPAKMARERGDGAPLERDLLRSKIGHDFSPEQISQSLAQIRSGWPKKPEDYPKGFAVASPPGFCFDDCDCMDDQRPQRSWETRKGWLEDTSRSSAALNAIQVFSEQTHFVRRRGQVSKMCYFETAQQHKHDQTHARAALDLAQRIEKAVQSVLQQIPIASLAVEADPVRVPGRAFLAEDKDYLQLRYAATTAVGGELPPWLRIEPDDGRLVATKLPPAGDLPLNLKIELFQAEGATSHATCTIVGDRFPHPSGPWLVCTPPIGQLFTDGSRCPLERGVRAALHEHVAEVYDFNRRTARERSLGVWLGAMVRIMCLLRSAAGANLAWAAPTPTTSRF